MTGTTPSKKSGALRLSVVTPVLNDTRVEAALQSILSQKYAPSPEIIVVDGGSSDGTLDVLSKYESQIHTLVSEPDKGIYDGMNKGIRMATGDVVGILNADDKYHDSRVVQDVMRIFETDTPDACYGDMVYTTGDDKISRYWKAGKHSRFKWYFGWMPPHPTFFVRRSVYRRHGLFDLDYTIAADYELMLRLIFKEQINIEYVNRVLVKMAPGGTSSRVVQGNVDTGKAWVRNKLHGGYLVPVLKPARKLFQLVNRP